MATSDLSGVERYYEGTRWDYRWVWGVRNTYALHFGYYDEIATHHKAAVANMNRVMADMVQITSEDRVLDAGCGVGGSGIWLAKQRRCSVVGITPVAGQIKDAKLYAEKAQVADRASFQKADYLALPFEDASFDVVWALESVCHAAQKIEFYREAFRVLKPGGRLVLAEYIRAQRPYSRPATDEALLQDWLSAWVIPDLDTAAEHERHATAAGFEGFQLQNVTRNTRQSLKNIREHGNKWLWAAKALHKIGIVSKVQVRNVEATIHLYDALEQELWYYGLLQARKVV